MHIPDLSGNPALWLGCRQAESLREALIISLNGKPLRNLTTEQWLKSQGIDCDDKFPDVLNIRIAMTEGFQNGYGIDPEILVRASNAPDPEWVDLGEERSGAGWRNPANFLISSAFVRLLGAWEQYELDVLKALFYYRPLGLLGDGKDQLVEYAEAGVIRELPVMEENKQVFSKPPVWTWVRQQAEKNHERASIFKNVFGIQTIPEPKKANNKRRDAWYESRNKIAHGRAGVEMTLLEYIEVDVFVAQAMTFVSMQCRDKLKLMV